MASDTSEDTGGGAWSLHLHHPPATIFEQREKRRRLHKYYCLKAHLALPAVFTGFFAKRQRKISIGFKQLVSFHQRCSFQASGGSVLPHMQSRCLNLNVDIFTLSECTVTKECNRPRLTRRIVVALKDHRAPEVEKPPDCEDK